MLRWEASRLLQAVLTGRPARPHRANEQHHARRTAVFSQTAEIQGWRGPPGPAQAEAADPRADIGFPNSTDDDDGEGPHGRGKSAPTRWKHARRSDLIKTAAEAPLGPYCC